jgi:hypothetical protein
VPAIGPSYCSNRGGRFARYQSGEFFFHTDEMYHAMNALFVRDFLVDLPIHHPVQYAYEYYAKYPAVALPHWPPLFYVAEGIAFLIFGISTWASRLVVLGFALLVIYFRYRIAVPLGPSITVFISFPSLRS